MHVATRRTLLSGSSAGGIYVPEWVTWLDGLGKGVQCAYDFRGVSALEDGVHLGNVPTYALDPGTPTFSANGLVCNQDTILNTGYNPSVTGTWACLFTNADLSPALYHHVFGSGGATYLNNDIYVRPYGRSGDSSKRVAAWRVSSEWTGTYTNGWFAIVPEWLWINGTLNYALDTNTMNASGRPIYVGGFNRDNSYQSAYKGTIQAYFATTATLTDPQLGLAYTKMLAG